MLPQHFQDPSLWLKLKVDAIYWTYGDGQLLPEMGGSAEAVYQPSSAVPSVMICRISDSEKRLEQTLTVRPAVRGAWGVLYEVLGQGAVIGTAMEVAEEAFSVAHVLPDMVHLVSNTDNVSPDSIMKSLYNFKTFRSFRLGSMMDDGQPHDVLVTTKSRWFRNRNNPKFLGFSKDEKP